MTEQAKGTALASGGMARGIIPQTFEEAYRLARVFAATEMVPKEYRGKPEDCCVAVMQGLELGLSPIAALQSIAVVNGRPCLYGDGMVAVVRGSGLLEWMKETDDGAIATCTVKRKGEPEPVVRTFSQEDAKRAGLAGKSGPWTQYPQRMRAARARSWALRDTFADVLKGIASAEEQQDVAPMRDITPARQRPNALELPEDGNPVTEVADAATELPSTETRPTDAQFLDALESAMMVATDVDTLVEVWDCNIEEISERGIEQAAEDLRDHHMTRVRAATNKPSPEQPQEGSASASLDMPEEEPAPAPAASGAAIEAELAALDKRLSQVHNEGRVNQVFKAGEAKLRSYSPAVIAQFHALLAKHRARVRALSGYAK